MLDDRNAKSIQNNKRIPKYKIGDDNIVKNTNEKQRNYLNIAS
jgi:ribosomal protein L39E